MGGENPRKSHRRNLYYKKPHLQRVQSKASKVTSELGIQLMQLPCKDL